MIQLRRNTTTKRAAAAKRKVKTQDQLDHIAVIELYEKIGMLTKALDRVQKAYIRADMATLIGEATQEEVDALRARMTEIMVEIDVCRNQIKAKGY